MKIGILHETSRNGCVGANQKRTGTAGLTVCSGPSREGGTRSRLGCNSACGNSGIAFGALRATGNTQFSAGDRAATGPILADAEREVLRRPAFGTERGCHRSVGIERDSA